MKTSVQSAPPELSKRFWRCWHQFLLWPAVLLPTLAVAQSTYTPYSFSTQAGAPGVGNADGTGSAARFNRAGSVAVDSAGNTYVADTGSSTIRKITPSGVVTTLAGAPGITGSTDGTGTAARFFRPVGIAVDGSDIIYVADTGNNTIRKITIGGVVSTLAGTPGTSGYLDGTGGAAQFIAPKALAVDGAGNVFVSDSGNNVIRRITPSGVVTTPAGTGMLPSAGSADGTGSAARFDAPHDTAVDSAGNVYVADAFNNTIRKITSSGVVTTLAGSAGIRGGADGTGSAARFNAPNGLTVDTSGNIYVADTTNCAIRKITPAGVVTTVAGSPGVIGSADGTGSAATFRTPGAVAVDSAGNLYVADTGNYTIRKITPAGVVTTLAGVAGTSGLTDGTGTAALFLPPTGIAIDSGGNLYVADPTASVIRKVTSAGVVTTPLGASFPGSADGTGNAAQFSAPRDIAADGAGNLFVADTNNETIRMVTPAGVVTTLAGTVRVSGSVDGTGSAAQFNTPLGLSVDSAGNLYVADSGSNLIRKVTSSGVVTSLAGSKGNTGFDDGTGAAAQFNAPAGICSSNAGNFYVADAGNNTIRMITPAGVVTTVAGSARDRSNFSRDGSVAVARFDFPSGVAVDSTGNLFIADTGNSTIRLLTPAGIVSTLAGIAGLRGMVDGVGSAAELNSPGGLAIDGTGTLHVADIDNSAIRQVALDGTVTTLAGFGLAGSKGSADGSGAAARFNEPSSVAVDASGNVYVADTYNATVRKITPDGSVSTVAGTPGSTGSTDGVGSGARFFDPAGVASDGAGNLYVADVFNATIRKITPDGTVSTLAGTAGSRGSADGTGGAAQFNRPLSVAVDSAGNVFVGDAGSNTIRKISPAGVVTTFAGFAGSSGYVDGTGSVARFSTPQGLAVDGAGNVYVADSDNNAIRKITPDGTATTLAGSQLNRGSNDGTGINAWFSSPTGLAVDSAGNVYVADVGNNLIRKITPAGVVTTLGGVAGIAGSTDGTGSAALFSTPSGVAVDNAGIVYVADTFNNTIRKGQPGGFPMVTTQPAGQTVIPGQNAIYTVVAGSGSALSYRWQIRTNGSSTWINLSDGAGYSGTSSATLTVSAVTTAMNGNSFRCMVSNADGSVVTVPAPLVVSGSLTIATLAGQAGASGGTDGTGTAARFFALSDVAVDTAGNVYVADTNNHTIRKVTPAGVVTTLAGLAGTAGSADGTSSAARFNHPSGVAVDTAGTVYVTDTDNNTIRQITSAGAVATLAGLAGTAGSADGAGSAASFHGPSGIARSGAGVLYIADTLNHTIRQVASDGTVTTLVGRAGSAGSADGTGSAATFHGPQGLAVDTAGHLYVADTNNDTIRRITLATGAVTTVAGAAGTAGSVDGPGNSARFFFPSGVAADGAGNLYIADTDNSTIREMTLAGDVITLAGVAGANGTADGLGAAARFNFPTGIAVDNGGAIYIADTNNHTVRLGINPSAPTITTQPQSQTVAAGTTVQFTVVASGQPAPTYQWSFNGASISGATSNTYSVTAAQPVNGGDYTVTVTNGYGTITSSKATLTVNGTGTTGSPSSGGGGAMECWWIGALALLAMVRCWVRKS
jgi:hypothetical protein